MQKIKNIFLKIKLLANRNLRRRKYSQGGVYNKAAEFLADVILFSNDFRVFAHEHSSTVAKKLQILKGILVTWLYARRGRTAQKFVHSSMAGLAALGVMIAPVIAQEFPGESVDPWSIQSGGTVLSATNTNPQTSTLISDKARAEIIEYTVQDGDTVSTVAEKFGVSEDTIKWQNDLSGDTIKVGQTLEVLPVTGVSHVVKKGDTVHSIAKKYDSSAQAVADFPWNSFANDETFELAIGQTIIVPEGVIVSSGTTSYASRLRQITPDAGSVVAAGNFVWPTSGSISQGFSWYHKAIDISNRAAPNILAADAGTVIGAGWLDGYGYGNRVIIDHGNGYRTLYAHLSSIYVGTGQTVRRGDAIGRMGTTGRSTGVHLHFEIIQGGAYLNPLSVLQ